MQQRRPGPPDERKLSNLKKELLIFGALFFVGLLVLPICVYVVGQSFIGEYSPEAGAAGLLTAIWADLAAFAPAAWLLVLSPWLVIQLVRVAIRLWRAPAADTGAASH